MQSYGGGEPETTEALTVEGVVEPLIAGQIVLGKYRIVGRLGVGGMAEVYEATHLQLGSPVALKLPLGRAGSSKGAKMAARLLREAQVGASLDPERVVRVFDVGVLEDGTPVIVLERLDGESMAERLARVEKVSIDTAIGWIREACIGLSEAHKRGIVHRDIKPSNLFLERKRDRGERLRILDFGIASIRAAAEGAANHATVTESRGAVGSPPYMSPEQIRDSDDVDARADVWALGVTLFELIAGRRPFSGVGSALVASIVSDPIPKLSSLGTKVDPALEALIGSCLERDPALRPTDASDLGARLDALTAGTPRPLPLGAKRRIPWRAVGIVGALALGIALAIELGATKTATSTAEAVTEATPVSAEESGGAPSSAATDLGAEHRITASGVTSTVEARPAPSTANASTSAQRPATPSSSASTPTRRASSTNPSPQEGPIKETAPSVNPPASSAAARSPLDDREF